MTDSDADEIWIGLAEVRQRSGAGVLMDRNEAFVNVLAFAGNESTFAENVRRALDEIGFDLVELEDPEPLQKRRESFVVSEDLLRLAKEVQLYRSPRVGEFYTWTSE
jgi:hypothetical protein